MQTENERKIATPPRRGNGLECRWRSWVGPATSPWAEAKSRTYRVSTNEHRSDKKNIAKKITVNYATPAGQHRARTCRLRLLSKVLQQ